MRKGEEEKRRRGEKKRDSETDPAPDLSKFSEKKSPLLLFSSSPLLPLLFLHLLIALPLAYLLNIWTDEASTLYTTRGGFLQAFHNVFADEKQAPLYFLLMSLWRKMGDSVFFARLFSVVCSLAAICAFFRLARKIWDEKTALFLTAFFALHPFLIWASLEIRLYSLVILITCLLFSFFYDGYLRDDANDKKAQVFYVLTAIAAVYTNYYLGFLLVGAFVALLVLRRWSAAKIYFWQMPVVGLAIAPLFWIIALQFADRAETFQGEKSLIEGIKILWNHFLTFVLPTEIYTTEEGSPISFVRLWIVRFSALAAFFVLAKNRFKDLDKTIVAFGTIAAVCAAFFLLVYFRLGDGYVEIRHAAICFTAVFVFVSAILVKILPRRAWIYAAILYAVFFAYAIYALHPNLTKRGDWARVAAFISQNETPNQPIIVFQPYDAIALPVYYRGANKILPNEKFFSLLTDGKKGSSDYLRSQIEFVISEIPPDAPEIWLLTNEKCEIKRSCEPLENFVQANYTIVEERNFYLEKVRLLRKKK